MPKKPREIYDAICKAAKDKNENELNQALQFGSIDLYQTIGKFIFSPVTQLAYDGDEEAVNFLLQHDASINKALKGYSMSRRAENVNKLLNGANINYAVTGYAIGNDIERVNELLSGGANIEITAAVFAYAVGGHVDHVNKLLDKNDSGAVLNNAVHGYALSNHVGGLKELKERYPFRFERAIAEKALAIGGHTDSLNKLQQGETINPYHSIEGYAIGGHVQQVEDLLRSGSNINSAICGYAQGGHFTQVNELLKKEFSLLTNAITGCDRGNYPAQANMLETVSPALEKINELRKYGKELERQGNPTKGQKAILLADSIQDEVFKFVGNPNMADEISKNLSKIMTDGQASMREDRKLKDILAHIAFACTGVGLVIIIGKKILTGSGFLNKTKRQKLLSDINQKITSKIKPRSLRKT